MSIIREFSQTLNQKSVLRNVLFCLVIIIVMHLLYGVYRKTTVLQEGARKCSKKMKNIKTSSKWKRLCTSKKKKICKKTNKQIKRKFCKKKSLMKKNKFLCKKYKGKCKPFRKGGKGSQTQQTPPLPSLVGQLVFIATNETKLETKNTVIKQWNMSDYKVTKLFEYNTSAAQSALNHDGTILAVGYQNGEIFFDIKNERVIKKTITPHVKVLSKFGLDAFMSFRPRSHSYGKNGHVSFYVSSNKGVEKLSIQSLSEQMKFITEDHIVYCSSMSVVSYDPAANPWRIKAIATLALGTLDGYVGLVGFKNNNYK